MLHQACIGKAMKKLINKFKTIVQKIASKKGEPDLFALFLRERFPHKWDVLIAADWIDPEDTSIAIRYVAECIQQVLDKQEMRLLSRVAIINQDNPALADFNEDFVVDVDEKSIEIYNRVLFGLDIQQAYVITSRQRQVAYPITQLNSMHDK